jgi:phytoene desaturase
MPFVIEGLFQETDEDISDYLEFETLETTCKYFYPDGTILNAYHDIDKFGDEIAEKTKDNKESVLKYLNYSKKIYELTAELFLFKSFTEISTFLNLKALKTLLNIWKIDPFRTMHRANESFFNDERVIQLFDRYATYNGSNPYQAPATLNIIQHVEYNIGGFIPKQGIYSLTEAMHKLAKKSGVKFYFNRKVEEILLEKNKVEGIKYTKLDEQKFLERKGEQAFDNYDEQEYDLVISNGDVHFTYSKLLKDEKTKLARRYSQLEPSSSALVFYWGVEGKHDDLQVHNILFSDDYKNEFTELFDKKNLPADPTIYIYISSKINSKDTPDNCENWFVMINTPYLNENISAEKIEKAKQRIIEKIKNNLKIDIKKKIIAEKILSPKEIEDFTSSNKGSIYGISSNDRNTAFLRQKNRSKKYKGLYFCGGSAHPGGGIPLVVLSGKITSDLIQKYEK